MAKTGLNGSNVGSVLARVVDRRGWTLCIGAGTSLPAFPDWWTLAERLLATSMPAPDAASARSALKCSFGADAAIEAISHSFAWTEEERRRKLSEALFADLQAKASSAEWQAIVRVLTAARPADAPKSQWLTFLEFFDSAFPSLTAHALAQVVADTFNSLTRVSRVITFNAEGLLAALISGRICSPRFNLSVENAIEGELSQHVDIVTHTLSHRRPERIPYFFCHGSLVPPGSTPRFSSEDKLVWSESEYLALSNSNYSWQATVFLDACASTSVVFVGVSLSDPNMRRWLSWVHSLRLVELRESRGGAPVRDSAPHYWLRTRPSNPTDERWMEAAVAHLGVRIVWLDAWADVGPVLRAMLGC